MDKLYQLKEQNTIIPTNRVTEMIDELFYVSDMVGDTELRTQIRGVVDDLRDYRSGNVGKLLMCKENGKLLTQEDVEENGNYRKCLSKREIKRLPTRKEVKS